MEIHFLGTGAGVPSKQRNTSAIALKFLNHYKGAIWLFDCGEATQHQILYTSLKLAKLENIFITHLHGDHIFGLPGLLGSRSFQGGTTPLTVYGPKGIKAFVETTLKTSKTVLRYQLKVVEIENEMIINFDQHTVVIKQLEHGIPSFGYRIEEKAKQGVLIVDRLKELGIKPGPIYKALKNGERVELEDGRILDGKDFVGPEKKGKVIAVAGDTRPCEATRALANHADILIHEATFMKKDSDLAYEYFHSTGEAAALIAKEMNVTKLILSHISSRYQHKEVDQLLQEAREIFPPTYIASDLAVFS